MSRVFLALCLATMAVAPVASTASPSPSPSLDTVIAAPPGAEFADDPAALAFPEGSFTAPQWAALAGTSAPQLEAELHSDGFVTGFARAWFDKSRGHYLIEGVVAFGGGQGAGKWLAAHGPSRSNRGYVHAIPVIGIDSASSGHFADPSVPSYSDEVGFIKGNDYFFVSADSQTDDLGDIAATQAKKQFDLAPSYTIPPGQWPENKSNKSTAYNVGAIAAGLVIIVFAVGVVALVIGLVLRGTRRRPAPIWQSAIQISQDGSFWWDGQAWRDASREAPPHAQRSPDGYYWWDGRVWRPVSRPPS